MNEIYLKCPLVPITKFTVHGTFIPNFKTIFPFAESCNCVSYRHRNDVSNAFSWTRTSSQLYRVSYLAWHQVVSVTLCITLFLVEITFYRTKHLYQNIMTAQVHISISTETRKLDSTELWLALFEAFKSRLQQLLTRGRSLNYAMLLHTRSSSGVKRVKSIRSIILLSVQPLLPVLVLHPLDTAVCFYRNPICYG